MYLNLRESAILFFILCAFDIVAMAVVARKSENLSDMRLEQVQVLFRHGERTPTELEYKAFSKMFNECDKSIYEPYGLGQLTNTGKRQAYDLGRALRKRYDDFLNTTYKRDDIYAYTSDTDRSKMSLQLVLAGLYPPTRQLTWNRRLKWLPIPFDSAPSKLDVLLNIVSNKKYLTLLGQAARSPEYREIFSKFLELVRPKPESAKSNETRSSNGLQTMHAVTCISIHKSMNLTLPKCYTAEAEREMAESIEQLFQLMSCTAELKKYNGGMMLRTFLGNIDDDKVNATKKLLYLYSGHDLNVAAVLRALNVTGGVGRPSYASALILEKYRDSSGQVYVKLLYRDTIEDTMTSLKLKGCDEFCGIDDFNRITRDLIPNDDEVDELLSGIDVKSLNCNGFSCKLQQRDMLN